jgi:hypothetical protein
LQKVIGYTHLIEMVKNSSDLPSPNSENFQLSGPWVRMIELMIDVYVQLQYPDKTNTLENIFERALGTAVGPYSATLTLPVVRYFVAAKDASPEDIQLREQHLGFKETGIEDPVVLTKRHIETQKKNGVNQPKLKAEVFGEEAEEVEDAMQDLVHPDAEEDDDDQSSGPESPVHVTKDPNDEEPASDWDRSEDEDYVEDKPSKKPKTKKKNKDEMDKPSKKPKKTAKVARSPAVMQNVWGVPVAASGKVTLFVGDMLKDIPFAKYDAVVCDPPWGKNKFAGDAKRPTNESVRVDLFMVAI